MGVLGSLGGTHAVPSGCRDCYLLLASVLQPLACLGFEVGFVSVSCSYNDQLHIFIFRMIHTRRA